MKNKINLIMIILASIVILIGCKKGDTGSPGPAGTNGTVNVISKIDTITPGMWSNPKTYYYVAVIPVSGLTNADQDVVNVYIQASDGSWAGLPLDSWFQGNDQLYFTYTTGNVNIYYENASGLSSTATFKVVVIPS